MFAPNWKNSPFRKKGNLDVDQIDPPLLEKLFNCLYYLGNLYKLDNANIIYETLDKVKIPFFEQHLRFLYAYNDFITISRYKKYAVIYLLFDIYRIKLMNKN